MIKVFSPASIGNIGPGFDVLGLAVSKWGDTILAKKIPSGIKIKSIKSKQKISTNINKNTVSIAAKEVFKILKIKGGIEFHIEKGLPIGSGLGSSASCAAAGAFAANFLYGNKLTKEQLILPATLAEEKVSGGFFADNTAPAILGGATLTRSCKPLDVIKIGVIKKLKIILITPKVEILTKQAREILPKKVSLEDFIYNMSNTSLISAAFAKNNYSLLSRSLEDRIIEPIRKKLIPHFDEAKRAAQLSQADGFAISGSGPTVFAITDCLEKAKGIKKNVNNVFIKNGISTESIITTVDKKGTRIIV